MSVASLTNFDYLILAIMVISTLFALFKGFLKTSLSIIGWFIAAGVSIFALPYIKPYLAPHIQNELLLMWIGRSVLFVIALVVMAIINYQILLALSSVKGGAVDRSLGFGLGLVRGALISCVIFLIVIMAPPALGIGKDPKDKSYSYLPAETGLGSNAIRY